MQLVPERPRPAPRCHAPRPYGGAFGDTRRPSAHNPSRRSVPRRRHARHAPDRAHCARPEYVLEADRDKTIVHHVAEGELFGIMRLMKPVAALLARSERARTVESLRRSLESD